MNLKSKLGLGLVFSAPLSAFAAVDPAVTTSFGEAVTDVGTVGVLIIGLTVAVAVIKYIQAAIV